MKTFTLKPAVVLSHGRFQKGRGSICIGYHMHSATAVLYFTLYNFLGFSVASLCACVFDFSACCGIEFTFLECYMQCLVPDDTCTLLHVINHGKD